MKPYKTFRQFLEQRELQEIATTQTSGQNPGANPQILSKFGAAVQNIQKYSPIDAISGKNPKGQQMLVAQGAKFGLTPAQMLQTIAPDQAKVNEPTPGMVQTKTMRKG